MNKKIISILAALAMTFTQAVCVPAFADSDTLYISDADGLLNFAADYNSGNCSGITQIVLTSDIDMTDTDWVPIGTSENPFNLTFDGGGKTISALNIVPVGGLAGMFGYVKNSTVKDLNISNGVINPKDVISDRVYAGIIAGINDGGVIQNCSVSDSGIAVVSSGLVRTYCGGLVGQNSGMISACMFSGKKKFVFAANKTNLNSPNVAALNPKQGNNDNFRITYADSYAGGIAGSNTGVISFCGSVSVSEAESLYCSAYSGGIAGENKGTLENCTSDGKAVPHTVAPRNKGYVYGGGVSGSNLGEIKSCTGSGEVFSYTMTPYVKSDTEVYSGGICGYNGAKITDSHAGGVIKAKARYEENLGRHSFAGGCVGSNGGTVSKCSSESEVLVYSGFGGGIVGENTGVVSDSEYMPKNGKNVKTDLDTRSDKKTYTSSMQRSAAGIAGRNGGNIERCAAKADVSALPQPEGYTFTAAGICSENSGVVSQCYYIGTISAQDVCGVACTNSGTISECYIRAETGDSHTAVYPLCGSDGGDVTKCYANDVLFSDGSDNDACKTDEQLKSSAEYIGWDFDTVWQISADINGGYPYLSGNSPVPSMHGDGSADNPYIISDEKQLGLCNIYPDKHYILKNDIYMTVAHTPIGTKARPFTGTFDGNGYTIHGLNISPSLEYSGLFGVACGAQIRNVSVNVTAQTSTAAENEQIKYFGAIVAYAENTTLENVSANAAATLGLNTTAGGIAGYIGGSVTAAVAHGTLAVSGNVLNPYTKIGAIAGVAEGTIKNSDSDIAVSADVSAYTSAHPAYFGGICAVMTGNIYGCRFNGSLPESLSVGRIISGSVAAIMNGNVYNTYYTGEPCGYAYSGIISESGAEYAAAGMLNSYSLNTAYPWAQTADGALVSKIGVTSEAGKTMGMQVITLSASDGYEVCFETTGEKMVYTAPFEVPMYSSIRLFEKNDIGEYEMGTYTVTGGDTRKAVIESGDADNLDSSIFDNITSVGSLRFTVTSDGDIKNAAVYAAAYINDELSCITRHECNIMSGSNTVVLDGLSFADGVNKIRIYLWGDNLEPYSIDRTVSANSNGGGAND